MKRKRMGIAFAAFLIFLLTAIAPMASLAASRSLTAAVDSTNTSTASPAAATASGLKIGDRVNLGVTGAGDASYEWYRGSEAGPDTSSVLATTATYETSVSDRQQVYWAKVTPEESTSIQTPEPSGTTSPEKTPEPSITPSPEKTPEPGVPTSPDEPQSYYIALPDDVTKGIVKLTHSNARAGEIVRFEVEPFEGYILESVSWKNLSNGAEITLEPDHSGTYSFVMPESNVKLNTVFSEKTAPPEETTEPETPTYRISVAKDCLDMGATFEVSNAESKAGETVVFQIKPPTGYVTEKVSWKSSDAETALAPDQHGAYSFVMPESDVELNAVFAVVSSTEYSATVEERPVKNGVYYFENSPYTEGTVVILNITKAPTGYTVGSVTYTIDNQPGSGPFTMKENASGKYTFTAPASNVSILITYQKSGSSSSGTGSGDDSEELIPGRITKYPIVQDYKDANGWVWTEPHSAAPGDMVTITAGADLMEGLSSNGPRAYRKIFVFSQEPNGLWNGPVFREEEIPVVDGQFKMPVGTVYVHSGYERNEYSISVDSNLKHGIVADLSVAGKPIGSAFSMRAKVDDEIIVSLATESGYTATDIWITADGERIPAWSNWSRGRFRMPAHDVVICAEFEPIQSMNRKYSISVSDTCIQSGLLISHLTAAAGTEVSLDWRSRQYGYWFLGSGDNSEVFDICSTDWWELAGLTVEDASGNKIEVHDNKFIMPSSNVVITTNTEKHESRVTADSTTQHGTIGFKKTGETETTSELTVEAGTRFDFYSQNIGNQQIILTPDEGYAYLPYSLAWYVPGKTYCFALSDKALCFPGLTGSDPLLNKMTQIPAEDIVVTAKFYKLPYSIQMENHAPNPGISLGKHQAYAGDKVTVHAMSSGSNDIISYKLESIWYVLEGSNEKVYVDVNAFGYGTFIMPDGNVKLYSSWIEVTNGSTASLARQLAMDDESSSDTSATQKAYYAKFVIEPGTPQDGNSGQTPTPRPSGSQTNAPSSIATMRPSPSPPPMSTATNPMWTAPQDESTPAPSSMVTPRPTMTSSPGGSVIDFTGPSSVDFTPNCSDASAKDTIISGIPLGATSSDIDDWVRSTHESGYVTLHTAAGEELMEDVPIATGQIARLHAADGSIVKEGTIIVKGDVLGTGRMNIAQIQRVAQHIQGSRLLSGVYGVAAKQDGSARPIRINDLVYMAKLLTA